MTIEVRPLPPPTLPPAPVERRRAGAPAVSTRDDDRDEPQFLPFGDDGLTFFDMLDIINPLQHIPVLSVLYRELSGDKIDPIPRVAGGAVFGGWIGAVSALVNVVVETFSGKDIGGHVFAWFGDAIGLNDAPGGTAFAANADNDNDLLTASEPPSVGDWARGEAAYRATLASTQNGLIRSASIAPSAPLYPVDHHA